MSRLRIPLVVALLLAALAPALRAFVYIEGMPAWPDGTVTLELQLGSMPTYYDGTTPNSTAAEATQSWNPYMGRVQLAYVNNSSATKSRTNGKNNVFFDNAVYGSAFGDGVLAVTVARWTSGGAPLEADVVVNSARTWESYRGPLWSGTIDLRRVLAHEFGHVLGLDHPDEHGQSWIALMNSRVSYVDTTQFDDQEGVASRYGRGTANPAVAPAFTQHPFSASLVEGQSAYFSGYTTGTEPMTFRWLKDGVELNIPTADTSFLTIHGVRVTDAGVYSLRATNSAGSATSNGATLTVAAAQLPIFATHPRSQSIEAGSTLDLNAYATSNVAISYQWTRDGANIPGATGTYFTVYEATASHAGVYRLVATTPAGSAVSEPATVSVNAPQPPTFSLHPTSQTAVAGETVTFTANASSTKPITYHWTRDGVVISNSNTTQLTVKTTGEADGGLYRCAATNLGGTTLSEAARLTMRPLPPPGRIGLPNTIVRVGGSVYLYAAPSGYRGQVSYQWYRDGNPLPGETRGTLAITSAQFVHAGSYFVVVSNAAGSSTSTTGILTVVGPESVPSAGWLQSVNESGLAMFLFQNPARIERFDLASESWLPPVSLSPNPTLMALIDANTAVVAFQRTLARVDLRTGTSSPLLVLDSDLYDMVIHNERLYLVSADPIGTGRRRIGSASLVEGTAPTWSASSTDIGAGLSIDHSHERAYFLSAASYRPDIFIVPILANGALGVPADSPYVDLYGIGTRTWTSPTGSLVFDNAGSVYTTTDLTYAGSVGGAFQSLAFHSGDAFLILRGKAVIGFDRQIQPTGALALSRDAAHLAVLDGKVFAFSQTTGTEPVILWERKAVSDMVAMEPQEKVSPAIVGYSPDDIGIDRDGIVLLYSRFHANIFRWSSREQRYLEPIALLGRPDCVSYSDHLHRLTLGYADGTVRFIDLGQAPREQILTVVPGKPSSMCSAGEFLITTSAAYSSWTTARRSFSATGTLCSTRNDAPYVPVMVWDAQHRRTFETNFDGLSCGDITSIGEFGAVRSSAFLPNQMATPHISLSPAGDIVLLGSGKLFDAESLRSIHGLPEPVVDSAWLETKVFTIRDTFAGTAVERRGGTAFETDASRVLPGHAMRLLTIGTNRLLAITYKSDRPHFTLLDADLNVRNHFEDTPDHTKVVLANLSTRAEVGTGDAIMIAGFVVKGSQPKRILVRAVGPGLDPFGVAGTLADPVLKLIGAAGTVAENDDWFTPDGVALKQAFGEVFAFSLADTSLDSALIATLAPGSYTAQVSGKSGGRGVALVEAYDLDADAGERRLINISTRAVVGTGDKVLIPGVVVDGTAPKRLLIRAVGPGLAAFGVAGVLADPKLKVIDSHNAVVAANDNWGDDNTEVTTAATEASSAFALTSGSRDAALVATLPPGSYTIVARGVGDSTGVALVEVYEVP